MSKGLKISIIVTVVILIITGIVLLILPTKEDINLNCMEDTLGGIISTENTTFKELDITEITEESVDYSKVIYTEVGIYAIIQTDDKNTLEDINKYFKDNYDGYKAKKYNDNYIVYVYNGSNISANDLKCE